MNHWWTSNSGLLEVAFIIATFITRPGFSMKLVLHCLWNERRLNHKETIFGSKETGRILDPVYDNKKENWRILTKK